MPARPPRGWQFLPRGVIFVVRGAPTESSGGTVFDVGFPWAANMSVYFEAQPVRAFYQLLQPFGVQTDAAPEFFGLTNTTSCFFGQNIPEHQLPYTYSTTKKLRARLNIAGGKCRFEVDGQAKIFDFQPINTENIWLGSSHRTTKIYYGHGRPFPMCFYRMVFWAHGVQKADIRPVQNSDTSELALWDSVRNTFLTKVYGALELPVN